MAAVGSGGSGRRWLPTDSRRPWRRTTRPAGRPAARPATRPPAGTPYRRARRGGEARACPARLAARCPPGSPIGAGPTAASVRGWRAPGPWYTPCRRGRRLVGVGVWRWVRRRCRGRRWSGCGPIARPTARWSSSTRDRRRAGCRGWPPRRRRGRGPAGCPCRPVRRPRRRGPRGRRGFRDRLRAR